MSQKRLTHLMVVACFLYGTQAYASSGTEGAAFLDIPVGAGPAALGSAYTPLAADAYAATWNPAGLGFLDSVQFSGQHLSYLESMHYEYLSFGMPLPRPTDCSKPTECPGSAIGGSVQYLGSGDIAGTDETGADAGTFSSYYAAYNLSYGRSFTDKLSLGLTGKVISAKIDDVSAKAYAVDVGGMYKARKDITLAGTLTNAGTKLKFLSDGDPLPLAFHMGAAYRLNSQWLITSEAVYRKTGLASAHFGGEWRPLDMLSLRMGYRTDTLKGLSPVAGLSGGIGLKVWGQELAYAWVPYGDLGNTHYISLLMQFGEAERSKRNLIQYQHIKKHRTVKKVITRERPAERKTEEPAAETVEPANEEDVSPDYIQLMEMLNGDERHLARQMTTN